MKKIYILGATGSIGRQTLEVIKENNYDLVAFSAGYNLKLVEKIIIQYKPKLVSVIKYQDKCYLENKYPDIKFSCGEEGLIEVATMNGNEGILVTAVVGSIGLKPTVEAIKIGKDIALANKETLVIAGKIIMELAEKHRVSIIPVDSEHSAIFQALNGENKNQIEKIIITASGGSFRNLTREQLQNVTVEDALKHPNWNMGDKITIDSATMINKGLEVIEAHHLFKVPFEKITTVLHKESIIHSMVEYIDGGIIAHLGKTNMKIPINYALSYPNRIFSVEKFDFEKLVNLEIKPMDYQRFKLLALSFKVGKMGGIMPTVMNAANEVSVELFLKKKISFLDIEKIVFEYVEMTKNIINPTLDDIILKDKLIKEDVFLKYNK